MQKQHQQLQQQHAQCQNNQQQQQQQAQNQGAQINPAEFEQMKKEYQAAIVERDRFQAQLEMLVQELEKSQVDKIKEKRMLLISLETLYVSHVCVLCFTLLIGLFPRFLSINCSFYQWFRFFDFQLKIQQPF